MSAAYNDMDMTDINGDLLSYTFRDKEELTTDTSVYAELMMGIKKIAESNWRRKLRKEQMRKIVLW